MFGIIGIATDADIVAREPQRLVARSVEQDDPGNRCIGAQKLLIIAAAQIDGVLTRPRCPTDIALKIGKRLLNRRGCGIGLFRLPADKRGDGLAIQEVGLNDAACRKNENYQPDKREDILGEQMLGSQPV
jgi:phage gp36-like protein